MLDDPIRSVMQRKKLLMAAPEILVDRAAKLMAAKNVGAILVVDDNLLVGIFTERDLLARVVAQGLDAHVTPLSDVMTRSPQTIDPDKPFGCALLVMYEKGFRHLPVVESGKPIGIVSSRSALDPELEEFAVEVSRRERYGQIR